MKYLFFLFSFLSFSQERVSVNVFSIEDKSPLENAIVLNMNTNSFEFVNKDGSCSIDYMTENDSLKIILTSFNNGYASIKDFLKSNDTIFLQPKITELKEVILYANKNKSSDFYKPKTNKKYFSSFISSGGSILSEYTHKDKDKKIQSISFYFDSSNINAESVEIRPLIFVFESDNPEKWIDLVNTPNTISIVPNENELNISFEGIDIEIKKNKRYLIGFEIIDKTKLNKVKLLATSIKNQDIFIKPHPNKDWFKLGLNKGTRFSIYFELYFKNNPL